MFKAKAFTSKLYKVLICPKVKSVFQFKILILIGALASPVPAFAMPKIKGRYACSTDDGHKGTIILDEVTGDNGPVIAIDSSAMPNTIQNRLVRHMPCHNGPIEVRAEETVHASGEYRCTDSAIGFTYTLHFGSHTTHYTEIELIDETRVQIIANTGKQKIYGWESISQSSIECKRLVE